MNYTFPGMETHSPRKVFLFAMVLLEMQGKSSLTGKFNGDSQNAWALTTVYLSK